MTTNDFIQVAVFLVVLLLLIKPVGSYMAQVFADAPNRVTRFGAPVERLLYRLCGIRADEDMGWRRYAIAMLVFNMLGLLAVYLLQRVQQWLPLNPQHFGAVTPDSAINTAISFASNTNWQGYGGESTMSYLTQALVLLGEQLAVGEGHAEVAHARRRHAGEAIDRLDHRRGGVADPPHPAVPMVQDHQHHGEGEIEDEAKGAGNGAGKQGRGVLASE